MDSYIGCKIVKAEPRGRWKDNNELVKEGDVRGGEVEPGYVVLYEDGYQSWSPKGTFERAYRRVTDAERELVLPA